MNRDRSHFLLLNIGHFFDHLFMLIFATVAALALNREWGVGYAELLVYATPGFVAFGIFAVPAGWLADRWSRDGMMCVFFCGIGSASIATGMAATPLQIGAGLFAIGTFGAIYHPVGMAILTMKWRNTGIRIAANGVWGNLGVATAALITGFLIDHGGWRIAFVLPGALCVVTGLVYLGLQRHAIRDDRALGKDAPAEHHFDSGNVPRGTMLRISAIVFVATAAASIVFQSTTFALPKVFNERLHGLVEELSTWLSFSASGEGDTATVVGSLAFVVFAASSMAQLVVGSLLDRFGPRSVFMAAAAMQVVFFAAMPDVHDGLAFAVALGFMFGAFGQVPITDYMISKMASGRYRARIYGVRYVVAFTALALTLPLIAFVYDNGGFDALFYILASSALLILLVVAMLPSRLPDPAIELVAAE